MLQNCRPFGIFAAALLRHADMFFSGTRFTKRIDKYRLLELNRILGWTMVFSLVPGVNDFGKTRSILAKTVENLCFCDELRCPAMNPGAAIDLMVY